jgi:hypothetical protein
MKGTIKTLNNEGHGAVMYDTETGEGTQDARQELSKAERVRAAFFDGTTKERITGSVNLEEHEEILVVPPMAGGCG